MILGLAPARDYCRAVLDHISIGVSDLAAAARFYDAVLAPLGYVRVLTHPRAAGYGKPGDKDEAFAILAAGADARAPGAGCHIAFRASNREAVGAFHETALRMGGADEGVPGPRPQYGAGYYAAFVRDPDGYRIEAVLHEE
jgi:catechol 2,3-dioxygenase-like lactoylglutathione lyase family enzyme